MTPVATLMSAARHAAACMACGRPPETISQRVDVRSDGLEIVVRCHGREDVIRVGRSDLLSGSPARALGHAFGRLQRLFPDDGYPDMIELLKYNRTPWKAAA